MSDTNLVWYSAAKITWTMLTDLESISIVAREETENSKTSSDVCHVHYSAKRISSFGEPFDWVMMQKDTLFLMWNRSFLSCYRSPELFLYGINHFYESQFYVKFMTTGTAENPYFQVVVQRCLSLVLCRHREHEISDVPHFRSGKWSVREV